VTNLFTYLHFLQPTAQLVQRTLALGSLVLFTGSYLTACAEQPPTPREQGTSAVSQRLTESPLYKRIKKPSRSEVPIRHRNQQAFEAKVAPLLATFPISQSTFDGIQRAYVGCSSPVATGEEREALFQAYYAALEKAQQWLEGHMHLVKKPDAQGRYAAVWPLRQRNMEGAYYYLLDEQVILNALPASASTPAIVHFLSIHAAHDSLDPFEDASVAVTWPQLSSALIQMEWFTRKYPTFPVSLNTLRATYLNAFVGNFDNSPLHTLPLNEAGEAPLRNGAKEAFELYLEKARGAAGYPHISALYQALKANGFLYRETMRTPFFEAP
jgi:hypothetical protein